MSHGWTNSGSGISRRGSLESAFIRMLSLVSTCIFGRLFFFFRGVGQVQERISYVTRRSSYDASPNDGVFRNASHRYS